jgi:gluconolactonase
MSQDWSRRLVMAGIASGLALTAARSVQAQPTRQPALPAKITRHDPAFDALIDPEAMVEPLLDGLRLSEGPVWVGGRDGYLLVSDVPGNVVHRWSARDGASEFLAPSGYAGPRSPMTHQSGSNGLIAARGGLVMADSGNRGLARVDLRTRRKTMLCTHFEGRRFNAPNDLVLARDGSIYFSDPTYGLAAGYRQLDFTGVYRLAPDGAVSLIERNIANPNGVGLSPDSRTLYTTEQGLGWIAIDLDAQGRPTGRRYFVRTADTGIGGGDGFKIDDAGNMWTSSSEGVSVFNPQGKPLGAINVGPSRHSNCELGGDGYLYVALGGAVARVPIKARGLVFA